MNKVTLSVEYGIVNTAFTAGALLLFEGWERYLHALLESWNLNIRGGHTGLKEWHKRPADGLEVHV